MAGAPMSIASLCLQVSSLQRSPVDCSWLWGRNNSEAPNMKILDSTWCNYLLLIHDWVVISARPWPVPSGSTGHPQDLLSMQIWLDMAIFCSVSTTFRRNFLSPSQLPSKKIHHAYPFIDHWHVVPLVSSSAGWSRWCHRDPRGLGGRRFPRDRSKLPLVSRMITELFQVIVSSFQLVSRS